MANAAAVRFSLPDVRERADASAWLAVAAGTLGALMATLDVSIVNSSLPTIQGEIGASGSEGTWVATAYLVAEIIVIPLAAWLSRLFGLRSFLMTAASLFTGFSMVCGTSTSLIMMVVGRVGQGFTGGAMIPTAQTIIAQRLPPRQQPIGIAAFGVTAILGPVLGPLVGGWLTENISWHYAFFLNVPICGLLITLLFVGLPHEPSRLRSLGDMDRAGVVGLALGLGGLTVMLEEGQREQWFSSDLIRTMLAMSLAGFALLFYGQATAQRPVVRLSLLLDRQFGAVCLMGMIAGVVLFGTTFAIPQFLTALAGYDALQSGQVVLISGLPALVMIAFAPLLLQRLDIRIAVAAGLAITASASFVDAHLTIATSGDHFTPSQLMRGVGQILTMLFLNQAVVRSVPREHAGDASGLFNAIRNLGGSFALAGNSIVQDQRVWLHSRRLEETLNANSPAVQSYVAGLAAPFHDQAAGVRLLSQQIFSEALTMTYNDIFWIMGIGSLAVLPLIFFLKPLPKTGGLLIGH